MNATLMTVISLLFSCYLGDTPSSEETSAGFMAAKQPAMPVFTGLGALGIRCALGRSRKQKG